MRRLLAFAALAAIASAQAPQTVPASLGERPGNVPMVLEEVPGSPPGTPTTLRIHGVYDGIPARTIRSVSLRPAWRDTSTPVLPFSDVRIDLSPGNPPARTDYYAASIIATTSVGPMTFASVPMAQTRRGSISEPEPWAWTIPLEVPYAHPGGTLRIVIELDFPWGGQPLAIDAVLDGLTTTPMRSQPDPVGCTTLPTTWGETAARSVGYYAGQVYAISLLDPMHDPGPGETDWICTGLLSPMPFAGCEITQDLSIAVQLGDRAVIAYPPGLSTLPVTLSSQRIRVGSGGAMQLGPGLTWGISRMAMLEGSTPDFQGSPPLGQMSQVWAWAPVLRIQ